MITRALFPVSCTIVFNSLTWSSRLAAGTRVCKYWLHEDHTPMSSSIILLPQVTCLKTIQYFKRSYKTPLLWHAHTSTWCAIANASCFQTTHNTNQYFMAQNIFQINLSLFHVICMNMMKEGIWFFSNILTYSNIHKI